MRLEGEQYAFAAGIARMGNYLIENGAVTTVHAIEGANGEHRIFE